MSYEFLLYACFIHQDQFVTKSVNKKCLSDNNGTIELLDYANNYKQEWKINSGKKCKSVRIWATRFQTEKKYDFVYIKYKISADQWAEYTYRRVLKTSVQ